MPDSSEISFQQLFDSLPGKYIVLLPDLSISAVTDEYLRATMTTREQLIGKDLFEIFPENPNDETSHATEIRESIEKVFRTGQPDELPSIKYDVQRPAADGGGYEERYWGLITFPHFNTDGRIPYVIHRVEDITEMQRLKLREAEQDKINTALKSRAEKIEIENKQTTEALEDARLRLDAALEAGEIGTWTWDVKNNSVYADKSLANLFSVSETDAKGGAVENYIKAIHPDDQPRVEKVIGASLENSDSYEAEYRIVGAADRIRWVVARGKIVRDKNGEPLQLPGVVIDITRQKESEEALRESQERLTFALQVGRAGSFEWNIKDDINIWSPELEKLYGVPVGTFEKNLDAWAKRVVPEDAQIVSEGITKALENHESNYEYEFRAIMPDGEYCWFAGRANFVYEADGTPLKMIGINIDIADRKKSEVALREAEERFQLVSRATNDSIWDWNLQTNHVWWNNGVKTMFGYRDEEVEPTATWWYEHIHPEDRDRVVASIHDVIDHGGENWSDEYRFLCADGSFKYIFDRGFALHRDGQPLRMLGAMQDITEAKLSQEMLIERTQLATFNAHIGIALNQSEDLQQILKDCTDALVQHLGVSFARIWTLSKDKTTLELQSSSGLYTHLDGDHSRVPVGKFKIGLIAEERQPHFTNDVQNDPRVGDKNWAQKEEMLAFAGYPLLIEDKLIGVMAAFSKKSLSDATLQTMESVANVIANGIKRKQVEQERTGLLEREQSARQEAENANRLKDEFLATLSHELRTPLTSILGWSRMLGSGQVGPEQTKRALETIERNAKSQSQLIEDVLDVSRIISGKMRLEVRPVDLSSIIEASLDAVRPAADAKEIRLQRVLDSGVGLIAGDSDRLQQIIWNLLSNAIKFTPKHGRVQVKLERINSHIEVIIADNGQGVDRETLPFIFERFRQSDSSTTRKHGGLGLGLAIVRHLVELHGGTVYAASEGIDKGTIFTLMFPLMALRSDETSLNEKDSRVHPTADEKIEFECPAEIEGLRILVVDDEQDTRMLLASIFENCHAVITTASSAGEAIEKIENDHFDILVSDIGMPEHDGYELIRRVRELPAEKGGRIPAVALTAYARVEDRMRALSAGFQMHVPKPVEPVELLAIVASLVDWNGRQ